MEAINEINALLARARAEVATAKVTLADLGKPGMSPEAQAAYSSLHNAILRMDGTLSLDSQALLSGSDPASRIAAIQPVYDELVKAHRQVQGPN